MPVMTTDGVLWVWERSHSRKRERQLSQTHVQLMRRDQHLMVMTRLVRQNTRALVDFERTQQRMCEIMEGIGHEMARNQKAA